ncbi:bifunctional UDP-N-acetylmuramoyl-tripeptide:D-alanyl-D-alanine ligase/alanine racemase [Pontibacter qinzhouensis]|uniref:Alanine racemase n=1 Tax=Pontibacter qinzhouensis TaxID=2603253 RepID=A0A5C8JGV5_9BACT|nr:bifunctional UDP-N-acetylmuramoyl-tripeptide:D-alanyl-D-alanine ligase/alanine racemase [Pontibacter qinzhouensis]TXK36621.1 bifunctional UDP-N-acetylmuramoyl-tripeptide:D-alanyl-D-alanine ligase/alanine racemase [Pontibacter qinzhouensis]
MLTFRKLASITEGALVQFVQDWPVLDLLTDSRKLSQPAGTVFFAISGKYNNGHKFISQLYAQGVRQFVVEELPVEEQSRSYPEANFLQVTSSLAALQTAAAWHRQQFKVPVIGITGSNGKTIVKEWLAQLLTPDELVVKSPRSYNSQVGVPLSVWQLNEKHTLAIFEAGISQPAEMEKLQHIIQPTMGIFTNIGSAHNQGFDSVAQKVAEKLKLFAQADLLFYCADHEQVHEAVQAGNIASFTWSRKSKKADLIISGTTIAGAKTIVVYTYQRQKQRLAIPFTDDASVENALHCLAVLLYCGLSLADIQNRLDKLHPVAMRLEMKEAINGCYLIDDTYNNDLAGLAIALDLLASQPQRGKRTLILSDLLESGVPEEELYQQVAALVRVKKVDKVWGIGPTIQKNAEAFGGTGTFYSGTAAFLKQFKADAFRNEVILIKGARVFGFEKIVQAFQQKVHGTVLEVNLDALVHNLNFYRSRLAPDTRLMVMVKAFAYGSGSFEVANLLQFHHVNYLAVAYADEGGSLREHGITLPIMVMNPSVDSFAKLRQYNLEPEIYSLELLEQFLFESGGANARIHLKLDTGMHRLGFTESDFEMLFYMLEQHPKVQVVSVFTHLAGADEALHNDFSARQIANFRQLSEQVEERLGYKTIRHVLNSAGIVRFPEHQLDMVRLGIGLYGVEATGAEQEALQPVSTLKTTVSQVKGIGKGETVGYSRKGVAAEAKTIATIAIGYADGYDRRFSNGVGEVIINGKRAPIIGNVCMDMCMVDVTSLEVKAGDEVIVFGPQLPLVELAQKIGTIPYELLTNVSARVKRVFFAE